MLDFLFCERGPLRGEFGYRMTTKGLHGRILTGPHKTKTIAT